MSIKERFFKRKAQPQEIPSGAYEDFLQTRLTGKPSYPDVEGPRTLSDVPPERQKEVVQQPSMQPAQHDVGEGVGDIDRLRFDPKALDRRIYQYIQEVALPRMREAEEVLYYLQRGLDEGMFGESHMLDETDFVNDVDEAITMIDTIMERLANEAATSFTKLDEADDVDELMPDDLVKRLQEEWGRDKESYKEMLKQIGDPFAESSKTDPFSSPEMPEVHPAEYGDVEEPQRMTEPQLWKTIWKNRGK